MRMETGGQTPTSQTSAQVGRTILMAMVMATVPNRDAVQGSMEPPTETGICLEHGQATALGTRIEIE